MIVTYVGKVVCYKFLYTMVIQPFRPDPCSWGRRLPCQGSLRSKIMFFCRVLWCVALTAFVQRSSPSLVLAHVSLLFRISQAGLYMFQQHISLSCDHSIPHLLSFLHLGLAVAEVPPLAHIFVICTFAILHCVSVCSFRAGSACLLPLSIFHHPPSLSVCVSFLLSLFMCVFFSGDCGLAFGYNFRALQLG